MKLDMRYQLTPGGGVIVHTGLDVEPEAIRIRATGDDLAVALRVDVKDRRGREHDRAWLVAPTPALFLEVRES